MGLVERWVATRQGFKPRDVEEFIDYYWHRPLAGLLVQVIHDWPITPNQVTVASGVVSLFSGLAIGLAGYQGAWLCYVGAGLLLLSIVLDCADGQLARIKGISSPIGRILDGTMDGVAPISVFHGMAFFLLATGWSPWHIWPIGLVAGASLIWHANAYDLGKNIYLHCSSPNFSLGGDTLLMPDEMRRMRAEFVEQGRRFDAFMMSIWLKWTGAQIGALSVWKTRERTPETDEERALFREIYGPLMRQLTWLGFGTHLFILTMGALFAAVDSRAIWVAWVLIAGPLNIIAISHVIRRPRCEREFLRRLAEMRA